MQGPVRITIYRAPQCDPRKCSALKLERHGFARIVSQLKFVPKRAVVLNPLSDKAFSPEDKERIESFGLAALDCSWEHVEILRKHARGTSRCLPFLIAGNPVNFGKPTKLTTVEALSAALYIARFKDQADELLSIFTWGHTFLELNHERLERYAQAKNSGEIVILQKQFMNSTKN